MARYLPTQPWRKSCGTAWEAPGRDCPESLVAGVLVTPRRQIPRHGRQASEKSTQPPPPAPEPGHLADAFEQPAVPGCRRSVDEMLGRGVGDTVSARSRLGPRSC